MSRISASLRRAVERRARHRCEYCGLAQAGQEATFHIPRADGGPTTKDNLASRRLVGVGSGSSREVGSITTQPLTPGAWSAEQLAIGIQTQGLLQVFLACLLVAEVHFS